MERLQNRLQEEIQQDGIRIGIRFFFELQDPVSLYQDNGDLWVESFGDDGA